MATVELVKRRRGLSRWGAALSAVTVATLAVSLAAADPALARPIGPYNVGGAIEVEYDQAGGFGRFGNPTTPESDAAYGGKFQVFERNTSIYWHPDTGANQVGGRIRDKWRDFGWETGSLHYPTTRERITPQRPGAFNTFQGGSIYWSPQTDAHQIWGMVRDQWATAGWENSAYGFPSSDEYTNPDFQDGYKQNFENGTIQVVDMKVPAYGYVDPSVAARSGTEPQSTPTATPDGSPTASEMPDASETSTTSATVDPTEQTVPEEETSVRPTPPASIMPTTPGVDPPQNDGGVISSRTFPFGDFCVLGTYGGPGGACRFGDGVSNKDARCMGAIVLAAATFAIPATKVVQFRNFVKGVGGAREAFQLWRGASLPRDRALSWSGTGKIAYNLALEFTSLNAVASECR